MSGSKWNDKEIEKMLNKMPVIKNRQSGQVMYEKIKGNERKKDKKRAGWIPVAASLAALLLLLLLIPPFFATNEQFNLSSGNEGADSAADGSAEEQTENFSANSIEEEQKDFSLDERAAEEHASSPDQDREEEFADDGATGSENTESDSHVKPESEEEQSDENQDAAVQTPADEDPSQKTSLFTAEAAGHTYLKTALVTEEGYVIPFTFLLPDKENEDNAVNLYNRWANEIDEEGMGFINYHPVANHLSVTEQNGINGVIDQNNEYTQDSFSPDLMELVLKQTFGSGNYTGFTFVNEEGDKVNLDEEMELEISLSNDNKGYYLFRNERSSQVYFAQSEKSFATIEDAFTEMQQVTPNEDYLTALPEELSIQTVQENELLTVTPSEQINAYSVEEKKRFIEAVLLTAESFGIQEVMFENIEDFNELGFDLEKPLTVPAGPNMYMMK
ncbi:hypothetical protein P6709_02885 [Jeotgalibacillus sp. ET6]|uniref:hypothetical protein n=1 Tax=Jeotgalibacillus sp. ET6 TaxID=3037260 RepID=UPI002418A34A|nr:hypothetical protein [Jeotgalibacillus sp. ET6]MDG5470677.1 hypothetical protein [Jeotgalibacillus sp. ET6]